MQRIDVVLIGAGGYGSFYRKALFARANQQNVRFVGVVDPTIGGSEIEATLQAAGVPIFANLESFYAVESADLAVIAAPIHHHAPYASAAMCHGSNVLCEKPLCATVDDAVQMRHIAQETGRFVAVGYQWSYSDAIQALKRDILAGELGRPIRLKCIVLWPRSAAYYARNNWAGRIKSDAGEWVLDSPINNATAHYLHNIFYLLGKSRSTSAHLARLRAELYRANPIENYDTAALRCWTTEGVEILYYAAHPIRNEIGPSFEFEFEKATVTYQTIGGGKSLLGPIMARFHSGTEQGTEEDREKVYGDPFAHAENKLWQSVEAAREQVSAARDRAPLLCGLAAAMTQTIAVVAIQESAAEIVNFPKGILRHDGDLTWVEGLEETLLTCYEEAILPSEASASSWAVGGKMVAI